MREAHPKGVQLTAQQHRVLQAEHELKSFRAEITRSAPGTAAYRDAKDRADTLERELVRYRAGKLTARD